jgi:hypothetical protein
MNELNALDKAIIANALLRLVGEGELTTLEKRDILHEIILKLTGFNIADMIGETSNRRRLLLKRTASGDEYEGLPRELVFDGAAKTLRIFGEQGEDDTVIGGEADMEALLADMDYVAESGGNSAGWWRKHKSGWVEQGGKTTAFTSTGAGASETKTIALPILMSGASYNVLNTASITAGSAGWANRQYIVQNITAASFELMCYNNASASGQNQFLFWEVRGMSAES